MIRILTDSASDILPAEAAQLGVDVIPLNVTLEDGTVIRDGVDLTPSEYYEHMAGCKKLPTTSQPSPELFEKFYAEAAAAGDVLDQAAAAAFAQDVTLTMWGAEEDQDLLREISDKFIEKYGNYGGKITINLGAQSEKEAKDTVLTDPTAAADVFAFADDQLNELVQAGALQEVQLNNIL